MQGNEVRKRAMIKLQASNMQRNEVRQRAMRAMIKWQASNTQGKGDI